jgi:hypothetical protein
VSVPYPHWRDRHESVLLWLIEHPSEPLSECTKVTGYNAVYLSRIIRSPDFRQRLALVHAERERQVTTRMLNKMAVDLERLAREREDRKRHRKLIGDRGANPAKTKQKPRAA